MELKENKPPVINLHYGRILTELIDKHELQYGYLCKKLECSRYVLNKRLVDGKFKNVQKRFIDKLLQFNAILEL